MENKAFGELAARPGSRWRTTTGSGGYRLLRAFISTFERIKLPLWKNNRYTDNLYNYNIYIYIYIKHSTTIICRGADPLCPAMGSPYGGPVITGKPGIWLAPSSFGFSRSPLPALCRRATSCAWCSRLRKMPDRRSGCSCGHAEVRCGGHSSATLGVQTGVGRNRSGVLGRSWRPVGQRGAPRGPPEADGDARQTLRTVWSGGHVCPGP